MLKSAFVRCDLWYLFTGRFIGKVFFQMHQSIENHHALNVLGRSVDNVFQIQIDLNELLKSRDTEILSQTYPYEFH